MSLGKRLISTGGGGSPATVGEFRDGGVVFWVDPTDDTKGLVVSLTNQGTYSTPWSKPENYNPDSSQWVNTYAFGTAIGTGSNNTDLVIAYQGASGDYSAYNARQYSGGGFTDWFLPSKDELNEMYLTRNTVDPVIIANGGSSYNGERFYSSTQAEESHPYELVWFHRFSNNDVRKIYRSQTSYFTRAIRAFGN